MLQELRSSLWLFRRHPSKRLLFLLDRFSSSNSRASRSSCSRGTRFTYNSHRLKSELSYFLYKF